MARTRLIHWKEPAADRGAARLRSAGYEVTAGPPDPPALVREAAPAAFVISLDRRPASGRDLALFLRGRKATRGVPIVLVDFRICKVDDTWAELLFVRRK